MSQAVQRTQTPPFSPVVIGGLGGSGTRVLQEIVSGLGWAMGEADLNEAGDYLGFTLLFKDLKWRAPDQIERNHRAFRLIGRVLAGRAANRMSALPLIWSAARRMSKTGHNHLGDGRGLWAWSRAWRRLSPPHSGGRILRWGWKEPNSHIFLDQIRDVFPQVHYIHLLRHGLDMAWSSNHQQLMKWGPFFGIETPPDERDRAAAALKYWLAANRRAMALGREMGPGGFLLVRLEDLCRHPAAEVQRLASFLGAEPSAELVERLAAIPQLPASSGRHRERDVSIFAAEDLRAMNDCGYPWPAP